VVGEAEAEERVLHGFVGFGGMSGLSGFRFGLLL